MLAAPLRGGSPCRTMDGWVALRERRKALERMEIYSWNVNGLRSIYRKGFLDWVREVEPDILCLQETRAQPEQLPEEIREPVGFRAYFLEPERSGYSGVALFTRLEPQSVVAGLGHPRFDAEGRLLRADYGDFLLYNVYFPNGKASAERLRFKMDFYRAFLEHVRTFLDKGRKIVVCGDFNTAHREIDLARPKENSKVSGFLPEERAWMDEFVAAGFVDAFRLFHPEPGHYTWWDLKTRARERNVGWRIDYFFVSENLAGQVEDCFILPEVRGSDHCPVGLRLRLEP